MIVLFVCLYVCLFFATKLSLICLQFTETLAEMLGILIKVLFYMYSASEVLIEVYNAFINEESIEGVMEEVFTAMEHISKRKTHCYVLSISLK